MLVATMLKWTLEVIGIAATAGALLVFTYAETAASYAFLFLDTLQHIDAFRKTCVAPPSLPRAIRAALSGLDLAVQNTIPTIHASNLIPASQFAVIQALYEPHWTRMTKELIVDVPAEHSATELRDVQYRYSSTTVPSTNTLAWQWILILKRVLCMTIWQNRLKVVSWSSMRV